MKSQPLEKHPPNTPAFSPSRSLFQMMEQGARKQTATTATTRNRSSASEAAGTIVAPVTSSSTSTSTTTTTSSSPSSSSSATCSATIVVKQRPPPLKTATTTVTTTLVSSNEGGQPLPPIAQASHRGGVGTGGATLTTPSTPRIELSRASSSSHHEEDSRESSPENVFEQVGTGTLQETIGLGFREEGALELRSSTEELYFMDPEQKKEEQEGNSAAAAAGRLLLLKTGNSNWWRRWWLCATDDTALVLLRAAAATTPFGPGSGGLPGGRSRTPAGSRPGSRLRYYDEPVEGVIHIPLHTPPEEREARTLLQGIQNLIAAPSPPPIQARTPPQPQSQSQPQQPPAASCGAVSVTGNGSGATITASQLAAAAAALRPVGQRKAVAQRPDLDAIQSLPSQEEVEKEKGWSLEVQRHSSQDSQETLQSVSSVVSARASNLAQIHQEQEPPSVRENGLGEMQRLPSVDSTQSACEPPRLVHTVATVSAPQSEDAAAKERRRLLFATRLGSGSQEQIFSTQFSISKTESQSSQLSEQVLESTNNSTASDGPCTADGLQRQGTVIRRTEPPPPPPRGVSSSEEEQPASSSSSTLPPVMMRSKHRSRPTSEDEGPAQAPAADLRHSRYLENFDVRRKLHENMPLEGKEVRRRQQQQESANVTPVPRKPKRQSIPEPKRETSQSSGGATPTTPTPTPTPTPATAIAPSTAGKLATPTDRPTPTGAPIATETGTGRGTGAETPTPTASPEPMFTSPLAERRLSQSTDDHEPCECHEAERGESSTTTAGADDSSTGTGTGTGTNSDSLASVELLQQGEDMLPLLDPEPQQETRVYTDEEMPAPARHGSRSSGLARPQQQQQREPQLGGNRSSRRRRRGKSRSTCERGRDDQSNGRRFRRYYQFFSHASVVPPQLALALELDREATSSSVEQLTGGSSSPYRRRNRRRSSIGSASRLKMRVRRSTSSPD
ncbi:GL26851 [Drosophila persimilis]|uniref:GL26851 n=1 Tax=Drosophila persimilis TaxID=7234 RepID=B4H2J7_DROPE|nr:GL26851 [Drosophila persimilis]